MNGIEIILGFLGIIGIDGIVAAVINKRKELGFKVLVAKEKRYRSCLLYMDVYFNLSSRQADIHTPTDVIEYLRAEYHEMILYGS